MPWSPPDLCMIMDTNILTSCPFLLPGGEMTDVVVVSVTRGCMSPSSQSDILEHKFTSFCSHSVSLRQIQSKKKMVSDCIVARARAFYWEFYKDIMWFSWESKGISHAELIKEIKISQRSLLKCLHTVFIVTFKQFNTKNQWNIKSLQPVYDIDQVGVFQKIKNNPV